MYSDEFEEESLETSNAIRSEDTTKKSHVHNLSKCDVIFDHRDANTLFFTTTKRYKRFEGHYIKQTKHNYILAITRPQFRSFSSSLLSMILITMNIEIAFLLPFEAQENGGMLFLLAVIFFDVFFCGPVLFCQLYLGQFSGRSLLTCWDFAPIFKIVGIGMLICNFLYLFYQTTLMSWALFYIFHIFNSFLPWSHCPNIKSNMNCIDSQKFDEIVQTKVSSSHVFWLRYIARYEIKNSTYVGLSFSLAIYLRLIALFIALLILFLLVYFKFSFLNPIIYVIPAYSIFFLFLSIILGSTLATGYQKFAEFTDAKYKNILSFSFWYNSFKFSVASMGIGYGSLLVLGSFNHFKYSISITVWFVVFIQNLIYIIPYVFTCQIINNLSKKHTLLLKDLVMYRDFRFIFIAVLDAFTDISWSRIFTFLFLIGYFIVCMAKGLLGVEILITTLRDYFPNLQISTFVNIGLFLFLFIVTFLFSTSSITLNGYLSIQFIYNDGFLASISFLILMQSIALGFIYNYKNLSDDYKLMTDIPLNFVGFIMIKFILPLFCLFGIIISLFYTRYVGLEYIDIKDYHKEMTIGMFITTLLLVAIIPLIIFVVSIVKGLVSNLREGSNKLAIQTQFKPKLSWGPAFMKFWINDIRYSSKLRKYKYYEARFDKY